MIETISIHRFPKPSTGLIVLSFASNGDLVIERLCGWIVERVHLDPQKQYSVGRYRVAAEIRIEPLAMRSGQLEVLRGHKYKLRPDLARDVPEQVF